MRCRRAFDGQDAARDAQRRRYAFQAGAHCVGVVQQQGLVNLNAGLAFDGIDDQRVNLLRRRQLDRRGEHAAAHADQTHVAGDSCEILRVRRTGCFVAHSLRFGPPPPPDNDRVRIGAFNKARNRGMHGQGVPLRHHRATADLSPFFDQRRHRATMNGFIQWNDDPFR